MIITSTKFAVIIRTRNLSSDKSTSTDIMVSDSAPAIAGRRNSASQRQFRNAQVNRNAATFGSVLSLQNMMPSAAICGSAASATRQNRWRAGRIVRNERTARMTSARVPGNDLNLVENPSARRVVIKLYLIRHDKGRAEVTWIE